MNVKCTFILKVHALKTCIRRSLAKAYRLTLFMVNSNIASGLNKVKYQNLLCFNEIKNFLHTEKHLVFNLTEIFFCL